jgi:hypothetical protein
MRAAISIGSRLENPVHDARLVESSGTIRGQPPVGRLSVFLEAVEISQ